MIPYSSLYGFFLQTFPRYEWFSQEVYASFICIFHTMYFYLEFTGVTSCPTKENGSTRTAVSIPLLLTNFFILEHEFFVLKLNFRDSKFISNQPQFYFFKNFAMIMRVESESSPSKSMNKKFSKIPWHQLQALQYWKSCSNKICTNNVIRMMLSIIIRGT